MSFRFPVRPALPSGGSRGARHSGFTLVELVTIMVIVGILAVVALPRLFGRITFETRGYADRVRGALQYAQKIAVAERRNVCATVVAGVGPLGSISLSKSASAGAACTIALLDPTTGATFSVSMPTGVSISSTASPVIFDGLGQNVDAAGTPQPTVTVTVSGDSTTAITVEKATGYAR